MVTTVMRTLPVYKAGFARCQASCHDRHGEDHVITAVTGLEPGQDFDRAHIVDNLRRIDTSNSPTSPYCARCNNAGPLKNVADGTGFQQACLGDTVSLLASTASTICYQTN